MYVRLMINASFEAEKINDYTLRKNFESFSFFASTRLIFWGINFLSFQLEKFGDKEMWFETEPLEVTWSVLTHFKMFQL